MTSSTPDAPRPGSHQAVDQFLADSAELVDDTMGEERVFTADNDPRVIQRIRKSCRMDDLDPNFLPVYPARPYETSGAVAVDDEEGNFLGYRVALPAEAPIVVPASNDSGERPVGDEQPAEHRNEPIEHGHLPYVDSSDDAAIREMWASQHDRNTGLYDATTEEFMVYGMHVIHVRHDDDPQLPPRGGYRLEPEEVAEQLLNDPNYRRMQESITAQARLEVRRYRENSRTSRARYPNLHGEDETDIRTYLSSAELRRLSREALLQILGAASVNSEIAAQATDGGEQDPTVYAPDVGGFAAAMEDVRAAYARLGITYDGPTPDGAA